MIYDIFLKIMVQIQIENIDKSLLDDAFIEVLNSLLTYQPFR